MGCSEGWGGMVRATSAVTLTRLDHELNPRCVVQGDGGRQREPGMPQMLALSIWREKRRKLRKLERRN